MEITLIQTLKDKGNYDEVMAHGPYKCVRPHAWLGHGYYFWDTHIDLGHWWGSFMLNGKYIICQAEGALDKFCWDLHGNQRHLAEFKDLCYEIINSKISTVEKLKVPEVIEFAKKLKSFNYKAIRSLGLKSIHNKSEFFEFMNFDTKLPAYMDLLPPVQICLLEKSALSLKGFKVIYPEDLDSGFI